MTILVDLILAALLGYGIYSGYKQGFILVSLELISFCIATVVALSFYHLLGDGFKSLANTATSISNIVAFVVVWVFTEIACSLIVHLGYLRRFTHHLHLTLLTRTGGAVVNFIKVGAIAALALVIFAGLPVSAGLKAPITQSYIGSILMSATGDLHTRLAKGLGHDLSESLNFFTVTSEPESDQRIDLGYKTTEVTIDAKDEAAMLVLLNRERTSRNLPALKLNVEARAVARKYSAAMFAGGFFSHVSPSGSGPFDRMRAGGVEFDSAGENLALAPTLQQAHDGLMKSPGHRANILSTNYRTVGIGIIDGGPYGLMVTQNFTD